MKLVICAACKTFIGCVEIEGDGAERLAIQHQKVCTATPEEYEEALIDMKFRQITEGLDL